MAQDDLARGMARADLCRFLAACYYQPGPEFAEEKLFESMQAAASRVHPDFAAGARRLGEAFAAEDPEALLLDYTRLFLGPVDTLAKPYGAIWLRRDNTLMEESPDNQSDGLQPVNDRLDVAALAIMHTHINLQNFQEKGSGLQFWNSFTRRKSKTSDIRLQTSDSKMEERRPSLRD